MADAKLGAYDFAFDEEKIKNLKSDLDKSSVAIDGYIKEIFKLIGDKELGQHWSGESYKTFVSTCESYKPSLNELVSILKAYSYILSDKVEPAADVCVKDVNKFLSGNYSIN